MTTSSQFTSQRFVEILPALCTADTSADPVGWTPENPLWGHCAIAVALAHNIFGGTIIRVSLEGSEKYRYLGSYYYLVLPDGKVFDPTRGQFGDDDPITGAPWMERKIEYVLDPNRYPQTVERYQQLYFNLVKKLYGAPAIFDSEIYKHCFIVALGSGCKKMRFGSVIMDSTRIIAEAANTPLEPLAHLCEPTCIREGIISRRESMIGACAHAEELAIDLAHARRAHLPSCDIYVAGFYPTGDTGPMTPWFKNAAEHSCLRCSTQMYRARLKRIYVPTTAGWLSLTPKEACGISAQYALGEKSV